MENKVLRIFCKAYFLMGFLYLVLLSCVHTITFDIFLLPISSLFFRSLGQDHKEDCVEAGVPQLQEEAFVANQEMQAL